MLSLSKLYFIVALLLGVSLQVHAHAIISPALGVKGTPTRNNVQRPNKNAECGKVNIASTLGTTTPITAKADGSFTATITNFNAGTDGSRQVTALVDSTGVGKTFKAATVTKNGDKSPTSVGSQQLSVSLPAGTKCTGGANKNLCLVSFTTAGGFGNCVAVQQGAAAGNAAAAKAKVKGARAYGARLARAFRAAMEELA